MADIAKRIGTISFHDASLSVWEDPPGVGLPNGFEKEFKQQVFHRIIIILKEMGWNIKIPTRMIKEYGRRFAKNYRECRRGDLKADLSVGGRVIRFEMYQSINTPNRPDHGGKYEFDKEKIMPFLIRIQMEYTRKTIKENLIRSFGYNFAPKDPEMGPNGLTAHEYMRHKIESNWHYDPEIGRIRGEEETYNNRSADGSTLKHNERVWFYDSKGRLLTGKAYYNINNMWWVVTGKYGLRNMVSHSLFTQKNKKTTATKLKDLIKKHSDRMDFETAIILRDELYREAAR